MADININAEVLHEFSQFGKYKICINTKYLLNTISAILELLYCEEELLITYCTEENIVFEDNTIVFDSLSDKSEATKYTMINQINDISEVFDALHKAFVFRNFAKDADKFLDKYTAKLQTFAKLERSIELDRKKFTVDDYYTYYTILLKEVIPRNITLDVIQRIIRSSSNIDLHDTIRKQIQSKLEKKA